MIQVLEIEYNHADILVTSDDTEPQNYYEKLGYEKDIYMSGWSKNSNRPAMKNPINLYKSTCTNNLHLSPVSKVYLSRS